MSLSVGDELTVGTPGHLFAHVIFLTGYVACAYSFYKSVTLDPGHVPVIESKPELREVGGNLMRC